MKALRLFGWVLGIVICASGLALASGGEAGAHHGIDARALVVQLVGFAILGTILVVYAFPVLGRMLRARRDRVAGDFDAVTGERESCAETKRQADEALAAIGSFEQERLDRSERQGLELKRTLEREGREGSKRVRARAQTEAAIERAKAILGTRNDLVDMSMVISKVALAQLVDRKVQSTLVTQFIDELEQLEV